MRFEIIKNKELIDLLLPIIKTKYTQINGDTGGDDDFICLDNLNHEWCYCENGFYPFNYESLFDYQFKNNSFRLYDLVKMRN